MRKTKLISLIAALTLIVSMFAGLTVAHAEEELSYRLGEVTSDSVVIYFDGFADDAQFYPVEVSPNNCKVCESNWGGAYWTDGWTIDLQDCTPDTEYTIKVTARPGSWDPVLATREIKVRTAPTEEPVIGNVRYKDTWVNVYLQNFENLIEDAEGSIYDVTNDKVIAENVAIVEYEGDGIMFEKGDLEPYTTYKVTISSKSGAFEDLTTEFTTWGMRVLEVTSTTITLGYDIIDEKYGSRSIKVSVDDGALMDVWWNPIELTDLEPGVEHKIHIIPLYAGDGWGDQFDIYVTTLPAPSVEPEAPEAALTGGANVEPSTFWFKAEYVPNGEAIEAANIVVVGADKTKTFDIDFGAEADLEGTIAFLLGIIEAPAGEYAGTASLTTAIGTATSETVTVTVE